MPTPQERPWGVMAVLMALHAMLVQPIVAFWNEGVLTVVEETILSLVRQAFDQTGRTINGTSPVAASGSRWSGVGLATGL